MTLLVAVVAALAPVPPDPSQFAIWIPGALLLTAAELLRRAALSYKEGRQIDVDGAKHRETEAETELADVRRERDEIKADRNQRIDELQREVANLREEVRTLRQRYDAEVDIVQSRLIREIRVGYLIREWVAQQGLTIPDHIVQPDSASEEP